MANDSESTQDLRAFAFESNDQDKMESSGFTAVNGGAATVSPDELFLDHTVSAPNSNSFTNLTTPSMWDGSPDDLDSFETSPMFGNEPLGTDNWSSLFPEADQFIASGTTQAKDISNDIFEPESISMSRVASTSSTDFQTNVSITAGQCMSLSSGVTKNRRTGKPLGNIDVDPGDTKAVKRAKNTLAARKSRQKKRDIEESLRLDLAAMTAERDRWMHEAIARGAAIPESPIAISPR